MGESLHDMMLRRAGIQYNPEIVQLLGLRTLPEKHVWIPGEDNPRADEMMVHTVRFAVVGHYPDEDTPIRPVRTRRRT